MAAGPDPAQRERLLSGGATRVGRPRPTTPLFLLVAAGAALGALARWGCGELVPDGAGLPWTTLAVNASGSFLIGLLPVVARSRAVAAALGPGLLGGFTTFSASADGVRALAADGRPGLAGVYLAATVVVCVAGAWVARRLLSGRGVRDEPT